MIIVKSDRTLSRSMRSSTTLLVSYLLMLRKCEFGMRWRCSHDVRCSCGITGDLVINEQLQRIRARDSPSRFNANASLVKYPAPQLLPLLDYGDIDGGKYCVQSLEVYVVGSP